MNSKIEALRARKADGGFTLVELLIVIVVLGILAGIAVFGVASFRDTAEQAACDASIKTVEVAVQAFNAQNGAMPANIAALTAGGYIDAVPTDTAGAATVTVGAGGVVSGIGTCA